MPGARWVSPPQLMMLIVIWWQVTLMPTLEVHLNWGFYHILPWLWLAPLGSTSFYHGSTWLYYTPPWLLCFTWLYYSLPLHALHGSTWLHYTLFHGSIWLYLTLLHSTMTQLDSIYYSLPCLYLILLHSIMALFGYLNLKHSIYNGSNCLHQTTRVYQLMDGHASLSQKNLNTSNQVYIIIVL